VAAPLKVFEGSALAGARAFPDAMNIVAAVSFAGVGPERTRLEIWADPKAERNFHRLEVEAATTQFETEIDNVLAHERARASRLPALSAIASLRALVETLAVGV
jgi:aspartate dehydrogenase